MKISVGTNNTDFTPVEVTEDSISKIITAGGNWSPATFKDDYRNSKNFEQTPVVALDFDEGFSLDEAQAAFKNYKHIIGTTKSHQKPKNGIVCDRFRVVLFLSEPITDPKIYTSTIHSLLLKFPKADRACKDPGRMFYHCKEIVAQGEGQRVVPETKIPELPKVIDVTFDGKGELGRETTHFLLFGTDVNWNHRLYKAARDLHQQGYTKDQAVDLLQLATRNYEGELDYGDMKTIQSAYSKEPDHAPREPQEELTPFQFKSIKQLYQEKPSINWLVDGMCTVGGLTIIAGQAKAGKSTLIRQLCMSVARGEDFLGRQVKQGQVVYLALEEQEALIYEQFKKHGVKEDDPILYHVGPILKEDFYPEFEEFVRATMPTFLVIDTFVLFARIKDQNNYQEVYNALTKLRNLARKTGTHIHLIHHQNKSDSRGIVSVMGSSAFTGAVDGIFCFDSLDSKRYLNVQGRGVKGFHNIPLIYDFDTQSYTLGIEDEF